MELEIEGIRIRTLPIEVAPGLQVTILDTPDESTRLEQALHDPSVDPYASTLWPASLAVARELPGLVSPGDRVLDLGAGTGLATLTAARLGARATAYDHDSFALRLIEGAARMQGLTIGTTHFDLHSPEPLPPAELIIIADLCYDYDLAGAVARRIIDQATSGGRSLVADPGRIATAALLDELREKGINSQHHTVEVMAPGDDRPSRIAVHLFSPLPDPD